MARRFFFLLGILGGYVAAVVLGAGHIDGGVAALVGSALGAAITVLGSLWIAQYQGTQSSRTFSDLSAEAALALKWDAKRLVAILDRPEIEHAAVHQYAQEIREQAKLLFDGIDLFRSLAPFSEIRSYSSRMSLYRLDELLRKQLPIVEKELRWLDNPTVPVLRNTQRDLFHAASEIFDAAYRAVKDMGYSNGPNRENVIRFSAETMTAAGMG